ncbi:Cellulose synthase 2 operon protein C [Gluconacetobacter sp. SXCC-1]|uniref:cellulose synthase subunit BcsC-related outer membrane protein n=1 Tax=Komagataeibacter rhaeticus TaxID=215221 RepID=UPI000208033C|nr:cellulose synthase subunit BcsC-related outer membrane protein [Komagataeibacter rhaeticus]ATU72398.1 cellulose synthase [Komagataeibacter xylinus]EGG74893.1 Cellulose synthase 2 operon protein C [Gluconacetobacter sp. SXCC-1]WPP22136.1 cellulose synthase subunit BcsC-related outer membrane protein [Komagataeibacter rhaeticus]
MPDGFAMPCRAFMPVGRPVRARMWGGVVLAGALCLYMPRAEAQTPLRYAETILDGQIEEGAFWIHHGDDMHALHALQRALRIEPDNLEAGLMLGAVQVHQNDMAGARATLQALQAQPGAQAQVAALRGWIGQAPIDPAALANARSAADTGKKLQATLLYRAVFQGAHPLPDMELEYDRVLSGSLSGYTEATQRLRALGALLPHDLEIRMALAQALSYRPATRPDAIEDMRQLATAATTPDFIRGEVMQSWRRTLEWMGADPQAEPYYQEWLALHPDDTEIASRLKAEQAARAQAARLALVGAGYHALAHGELEQAERDFSSSMGTDPPRPEALEGLGLVAQRRGDIPAARRWLEQARALAPDDAGIRNALAGLDAPGGDPQLARLWALVARHQYDEAQAMLPAVEKDHGRIADTLRVRAIIAHARHELPRAEAAWRAVLRLVPGDLPAAAALSDVLIEEGRITEAEGWVARLRAAHYPGVTGLEAGVLGAMAENEPDPARRALLLEQALRDAPHNGWLRLHLAQLWLARGQATRARALMAPLCNLPPKTDEDTQVCFAFALQDQDMPRADALLARLPRADITAQMADGVAQVRLWHQISHLPPDDAQAVPMLEHMPVVPDPEGTQARLVVNALLTRHAPVTAAAGVLHRALADSAGHVSVNQSLSYAGLFMQIDDPVAAQQVLDGLPAVARGRRLTPTQARDLRDMTRSLAIAQADRDDIGGHPDAARRLLDPLLAQGPDDADLLLARGRVEAALRQPAQAVVYDQKALAIRPDDTMAQAALARDSLASGHEQAARAMARTLQATHPQWGDTWEIQAEIAGLDGRDRRRLADVQRARALDCTPRDDGDDSTGYGTRIDAGCAPYRAHAGDEWPDIGTNFVPGMGAGMPEVYHYDPSLTPVQALDRQADYLQRALVPQADGNLEIRDRSGQPGLGHMTVVNIPMTAIVPFSSTQHQLALSVMPSVLMSGDPLASGATAQQYGSVAAGGVRPGFHVPAAVAGVALSAHYQWRWVAADVGSTPLGFTTTNVLGGIELAPHLTHSLTLRLTGERRAVTDSLLAYSGARDPATGRVWGGVTRNRGHGQLEWAQPGYNLYAGGGYAVMQGTHTVANHEAEAGAGGSGLLWHRQDAQHLRLGLDLVYFGYRRNTYFFTWGQGGYFSPHAFMAALVPLTYDGHAGRWTWLFRGEAGYQHYTEHATAMFPLGEGGAMAGQRYAGQSTGGLAGNVLARAVYQLTPALRLGVEGGYSRSGSWDEVHGMLMLHYAPG